MATVNDSDSYNPSIKNKIENWINMNPIKAAIIFTLGTSYAVIKLYEHSTYKAVLKANKKTIQLLDWANNQIIY